MVALKSYLIHCGLQQSQLDACLFFLQSSSGKVVLLVGVHVDDLIIVGVSTPVYWLKTKLTEEYKMDDLGKPSCILGVDVTFNSDGSIKLSQGTYIKKVLKRFNFAECKTEKTPMDSSLKFSKDDEPKTEKDKPNFPYRELVACLLFISISTRPDIAFVVKELSRFLINPGTVMVKTAKRCLRYLAGTMKVGLMYHHTHMSVSGGLFYTRTGDEVTCFSDADWAGQLDDRKSTSGMALLFNGTAIMWCSRTIRLVACSSQDAEFMALSDASREIVFIQNLLCSIGLKLNKTSLYGDNKGSLCLAKDPQNHQKSKHISVRYFFVRQKYEEGRLDVQYVKTTDQLADLFTKQLPQAQHETLTLSLMGYNLPIVNKE